LFFCFYMQFFLIRVRCASLPLFDLSSTGFDARSLARPHRHARSLLLLAISARAFHRPAHARGADGRHRRHGRLLRERRSRVALQVHGRRFGRPGRLGLAQGLPGAAGRVPAEDQGAAEGVGHAAGVRRLPGLQGVHHAASRRASSPVKKEGTWPRGPAGMPERRIGRGRP